jgi:hypothetical protein
LELAVAKAAGLPEPAQERIGARPPLMSNYVKFSV